MSVYTSTLDLPAAAAHLAGAGSVLIATHSKPDGDALGSVIALGQALAARGTAVTSLIVPPVPAGLKHMRGFERMMLYETGGELPRADQAVLVDTGAWSQVEAIGPVLEGMLDRLLVLDHHLGGDIPAPHRYVDGHAAATAEIIADLLALMAEAGEDPFDDLTIAEALFVGIASDTGWFRFSNTRARTHELAARLLRRGVDQAKLYQQIEQSERPEKLALMVRALRSLEMLGEGRAAMMVLEASDFEATGALEEETERFVDLPRMVDRVDLVVLVTEPPNPPGTPPDQPPPAVRLSFRSKPGDGAINVARLAAAFGGGGHARAAGAKVHQPLSQVVERVRAVLQQNTGRAVTP